MSFTRRHLPHWIPEETPIFVTWRLAGSLPAQADILGLDRRAARKHGCATDDVNRSSVPPLFGPTWLQDPRVACVVVNALLYGETVRRFYQLDAWVVMPNHAHLILWPMPNFTLSEILKGREQFTATQANRILGRTGETFWQAESFDHWIRNDAEKSRIRRYIRCYAEFRITVENIGPNRRMRL